MSVETFGQTATGHQDKQQPLASCRFSYAPEFKSTPTFVIKCSESDIHCELSDTVEEVYSFSRRIPGGCCQGCTVVVGRLCFRLWDC